MLQTLQLNVIGPQKIHCESCEERIVRALKRVPGINNVNASAKEQRISVSIDLGRTTPEQVQVKLRELGYEVKTGSSV